MTGIHVSNLIQPTELWMDGWVGEKMSSCMDRWLVGWLVG